MGWPWSSSPKPAEGQGTRETQDNEPSRSDPAPAQRSFALTEDQRTRIFGRLGTQQPSHGSRDQRADAELENWLNSFSGSSATSATPSTQPTTSPVTIAEPEPISTPSRYNPDGTVNISPAAMAPRTMSCRQAFDQAFYCQSAGGKFNDIYRFGHLQDCSEQWGAFWFCMRNRTLPGKDKEAMIAQYYLDRDERRKKERGSSEDVWELRTRMVESAFQRDPDAEDSEMGIKK